ncbi:MAG: diguanylate cyclase [Deltaproteobacteria bacterium]|nr:diguanylate cyclase [Deltaproteobacteria bacterium]
MAATVLVVDDSEAARSTINRALTEAKLDLQVLEAGDGAEALPIAVSGDVDIIIADIIMPRLDGIELLRAVRKQYDPESLPVILVTSRADGETRTTSFESGVNDYLTKPFSTIELINRIQVQLRLLGLQTELRRANERYRVLGTHDDLTGLPNRRSFFDITRRELARSRRHQFSMSVSILDVDRFREVNNRVGYLIGDAIITELAVVLSKNLRSSDVLARLGGEKFAALLLQTDMSEARFTSERLCDAVRAHTFPHQQGGMVTLSVGTATFPNKDIESIDELINAAEASLDRAKERGGDRIELWDAISEI